MADGGYTDDAVLCDAVQWDPSCLAFSPTQQFWALAMGRGVDKDRLCLFAMAMFLLEAHLIQAHAQL